MHGIFFSILLVLSLEKASCEDKAPMQSTLREPTTQSLSETRGSNDCREKVKEMVESHLRQTTKHPRPPGKQKNTTTRETRLDIEEHIRKETEEFFQADCRDVVSSKMQFLTTEIESINETVVIYQIGIQTLSFEKKSEVYPFKG